MIVTTHTATNAGHLLHIIVHVSSGMADILQNTHTIFLPCVVDCASEFTLGSDVGVDSSLPCDLVGVSMFELGILLA